MKKLLIATVLIVLSSTLACAADQKDKCTKYLDYIDWADRQSAMSNAESLGDDSIYRSMERQLEKNNRLLVSNMYLTLLVQNKCPLPESIDNAGLYLTSAYECKTALIKGERNSKICDLSSWPDARKLLSQ